MRYPIPQVLLRSDNASAQGSWKEVGLITPEDENAMFAYSNLNPLPGQTSAVGVAYESGDTLCTAAASACRIVYRVMQVQHGGTQH